MFFANAERLQPSVIAAVENSWTLVKRVIVATEQTSVDIPAADMWAELDSTLRDAGIELSFAELKDPINDKLKRFGLLTCSASSRSIQQSARP